MVEVEHTMITIHMIHSIHFQLRQEQVIHLMDGMKIHTLLVNHLKKAEFGKYQMMLPFMLNGLQITTL